VHILRYNSVFPRRYDTVQFFVICTCSDTIRQSFTHLQIIVL